MKKYVKPTLEIIELRVQEKIARTGNTTTYIANAAVETPDETFLDFSKAGVTPSEL